MCYKVLYSIAKYYYINLIIKNCLKDIYVEDLVIEYDKYTLVLLQNMPGCLVFQMYSYKKEPEIPVGFIVTLRSKGEKTDLGKFYLEDLNNNITKTNNHLKLVINNDNTTEEPE